MVFIDRLNLYKEILLGCTGNSLSNKFKLVRAVSKNKGTDNLYQDWKIDNLRPENFALGEVNRLCDNPDRLEFWAHAIEANRSIFLRNFSDGCYYDVLDKNTPCTLLL